MPKASKSAALGELDCRLTFALSTPSTYTETPPPLGVRGAIQAIERRLTLNFALASFVLVERYAPPLAVESETDVEPLQ